MKKFKAIAIQDAWNVRRRKEGLEVGTLMPRECEYLKENLEKISGVKVDYEYMKGVYFQNIYINAPKSKEKEVISFLEDFLKTSVKVM